MTGIQIQDLSKAFGYKTVLDHIDVNVDEGEFVCLLGPSGCGKSTLLRAIAGLESPDSGKILFGDQPVFDSAKKIELAPEERNLGMVFQSFALWPHKTVFENVAYPLRRAKVARAELLERVKEALMMVDLWEHRESYPGTLSGGQQQRVSLARAVVARPKLLLLDEPLSSLDTNLRAQMRREIRRIQQLLGATAVYVTHDKEDAGGLADRVIVLQDGQIVQQGPPQDVFVTPRTAFVAEFVGFDNFYTGEVISAEADETIVQISDHTRLVVSSDDQLEAGASSSVAVRSRLVRVSPHDGSPVVGAMAGTLLSKAHLGDDVELVISDGQAEIVARVRPGYARDVQVGDTVLAQPPQGAAVAVKGTRRNGATNNRAELASV